MSAARKREELSLALTGHWRNSLLHCLIAMNFLNAGCAASIQTIGMIPPCPIPSELALAELRQGKIPPQTELFLSRVEVYCTAIDRLRE